MKSGGRPGGRREWGGTQTPRLSHLGCLFFFLQQQLIYQDNRGREKELLPRTHTSYPAPRAAGPK